MTRNSFKISFFLRKNCIGKDGTCAILMRITVNKEASQFATKATCTIDEWDTVRGCVKGNSARARQINSFLEESRSAVIEHIREIERREAVVTVEKVKNAFLGVTKRSDTLVTVFTKYLENAKKLEGISKTKATVQKYERCLKRVKEFMRETYNVSDIALLDMKYEFVVDFESFLRRVSKCNANTAAKFLQTLRMIVIYAKNNGMIHIDPFTNYKIRIKSVDRGYLTIEELERIVHKEIDNKRLDQIRDIFLFSCFTGLAYIDVANLSEGDIKESFDGKKWIMIRRHKTDTPVNVPLLDFPLGILKKYEGQMTDGKLLPVPSNQKMNSYLKEIATICNIDKRITFHLARHTFATTITLANGMPIETVSKLLGHTNIKTTLIYARITNEKIRDDMNRLAETLPNLDQQQQEVNNTESNKVLKQRIHPDILP